MFDLNKISDHELIEKLDNLRGNERETTLLILYHLIEVENRKLYLDMGYGSLFEYCERRLNYSEGTAWRRIHASKAIKNKPELKDLYLKGEITLQAISLGAKSIIEDKIEIKELTNKTNKELKLILAPLEPRRKEKVRAVKVKPDVLNEPEEKRYNLSFSVSEDLYEKIEVLKKRLSKKLGENPSLEALISKIIEPYFKVSISERKPKALSKKSRYIPSSVKTEVRKRDENRCSFVSSKGVRCKETRHLEFDHVTPFSLGGRSEAENIRLLCRSHNQNEAKKIFGEENILYVINKKKTRNSHHLRKTPPVAVEIRERGYMNGGTEGHL